MAPSVLGSVTLGYELIWNQKRRCAGVRLFVEPDANGGVDARHLLAAIAELWPQAAPPLLLQLRAPALLSGLLGLAPARNLWLEIPDHLLSDAQLARQVHRAHERGLALVWSGEPGQSPEPSMEPCFHRTLRSLAPQEALQALRVSLRQHHDAGAGVGTAPCGPSPIVRGSMYEGLANKALLEHALDRQGVWAVCGWPVEEVLHAHRFRQVQPSRSVLRSIIRAVEADESLETLEHSMGDEPLLTYRFLRYANSAHLGARSEVSHVRQGLMLMGYGKLRNWLMEQMPHASNDPDLDPIRFAMVLRARTMERLADAGAEDALRREVFLCGIFSQLDVLLGEAPGSAIHRLPLPGRITSAVVGHSGPYAPWLELASTLESRNTQLIRAVCRAHKMQSDDVNRALLRSLGAIG